MHVQYMCMYSFYKVIWTYRHVHHNVYNKPPKLLAKSAENMCVLSTPVKRPYIHINTMELLKITHLGGEKHARVFK